MPGKRIEWYLGPRGDIDPEELDAYEATGQWAAEEKHDGFWALAVTDGNGVLRELLARRGHHLAGGDTSHVEGLLGLWTPFPFSRLACELETGSEAATRRIRERGYRVLHVFDCPVFLGGGERAAPYETRRKLLVSAWNMLDRDCSDAAAVQPVPERLLEARRRLLLVESRIADLRGFYEEVLARGGEGLVLKRLDSPYLHPALRSGERRASGKVDFWKRCKPEHHVDYAVLDVSLTDLGQESLVLGLMKPRPKKWPSGPPGDVLVCVGKVLAPPAWQGKAPLLVGKVVELRGAEVFRGGMLRHAAFVRVREDKTPEMCEAPR